MRSASWRHAAGFSIVDMLVVVTIIAIAASIAIPTMVQATERMRLGQSAREFERELQTAKQRAIGKSRVIRVHINCPRPGQYRAVELLGNPAAPLAADTQLPQRCESTRYPYPAGDNDPVTRPNLDGPVRQLDPSVRFGAFPSIEFWPDGTARTNQDGVDEWDLIPTAGIPLTLQRGDKTSTIRVNGIGRVQLER